MEPRRIQHVDGHAWSEPGSRHGRALPNHLNVAGWADIAFNQWIKDSFQGAASSVALLNRYSLTSQTSAP
jgi:hypothetical protein